MFRRIKEYFTHEDKKLRDNRWIFASMLVGAIASLIASFVLSVEAIELAKNADAVLACNFNAVLNCATVGLHPSAHLFGFPNSFLGLIAEPIVITVAIAGLAGTKFPRLFMFVAQIFYTLGLIFAFWLFGTSYFVIGALCPWCLLVTATTTFVWFAITRYNIREGNLYLSAGLEKALHRFIDKDYDKMALFTIVFVLVAAILAKYGPYLF
ncbi:vitamin K epoxide reductase [Candidatus Saccharibacteria bacterium 32-50-10]|nr:MAG: vitamin K epoxide reductase [Candidatus Saccharibacteria bacterium 32-50-10]